MKIFFKPSFVRDFKKLPGEIKSEVRRMCTEIFPTLGHITDYDKHPLKKIAGFENYYRIKIQDYRVGFKKESNTIIFMRVKHRKDIYKVFP